MGTPRSWLTVSLLFVAAYTIGLDGKATAQVAGSQGAEPRITQAIDQTSLATLRGNIPPLAKSRFDTGPAPVSMPASRLILVLSRSAQQEAQLQTYLQHVQDANSPQYHKFLTPEEFGHRFGVGDNDLQAVESWLTKQGFSIKNISKSRLAIEFSGNVGQVEGAFHTSIHNFVIGGKQYWANTSDPQIPTGLARVVAGVSSLNSFKPKAQIIHGPSALVNPSQRTVTPTYTIGSTANGYYIFLGPADAATIYDTPNTLNPAYSGTFYDGTGVTIGVAGDSNIDVTQNANYRATFGLSPKATTVIVDGTDPGENGDALEAYLDTEVAGGIAPNANIILYTAADTDYQSGLFLAIGRALDDNQVDILNVSFGACESALGAASNQYIYDLWEQAAAQGISVTVSTGDSGSAGCDNPNTESIASSGLGVNGLASTPFNIAVGGTDYDTLYSNFPTSFTNYVDVTNSLPNHRSALQYIPEEPWNDSTYPNGAISGNIPLSYYGSSNNIVAAGGGSSSVYSLPSWQIGFGPNTNRNQPDVSFLAGNGFYGALWGLCTDQDYNYSTNSPITDCAGNNTGGNNFYLTGVGGTSASAPAFAGMLALAMQRTGSRLGQANYVLYNLAKTKYSTVFHDVTAGNNSVNCQDGTPDCAWQASGYMFLSGYNAGTGYDDAAGLGSVDVKQMSSNWASVSLAGTTSALQLNGGTAAVNITHGQTVTVNASVTSSGGTPTGDVALVDDLDAAAFPNNEALGTLTLASGSVSANINSLPGGSYQVSAHYGGSPTFAQSDSNAIPVSVSPESSSVQLKVAGYYDPSTGLPASTPYYGFIYLLDAEPYGNSASPSNPNGQATGTITFKSGTTTIGTSSLDSTGHAELQATTIPGGSNSLTAEFPGDSSFQASISPPVAFTVTPAITTLNLSSSVSYTIVAGSPVTLSTALSSNSAGSAPTGTATFMNGSTSLGTASLSGTAAGSSTLASGTATFTTSTLIAGSYSVTANYSGDGNYASSTSGSVQFTVLPTNLSVVVVPPSSPTPVNQPVTITVNLIPIVANGLPAPTGTVTLTYNGITAPPATVTNSSATVTIPANSLPVGYTGLNATYSGDQYYASTSSSSYVTMEGSGTIQPNIVVAAPGGTVNYPISVVVSVSGATGDPVATGNVTLQGEYWSDSLPLTNGSATFVIHDGTLFPGSNPLTAIYLGDSNYTSGTGTGVVNVFANGVVYFPNSNPTTVVNQPLDVTVAIFNPGNNVPAATGTVTLSSGSYSSSATQLNAGSATITIPANSLDIGDDSLTATYSGDSNYNPGSASEIVSVTAVPNPSLSIAGTNLTVSRGATSANTSTITLTPSGGFTGTVNLTATITSSPAGAANLPTLSFGSTSPVTINDTNAKTATLTVTTRAPSSASLAQPVSPFAPWYASGSVALACAFLLGIPTRRRRLRPFFTMVLLLIALSAGVVACGGGGGSSSTSQGSPGTTTGTYTITVTGTSGSTSSTSNFTLTVQ